MLVRALDYAARIYARPEPQSDQCCVFARLLLRELYGSAAIDRVPVSEWHLWDVTRPWSPVTAATAAGIARSQTVPPTAPGLVVGTLHQCQGWRGTPGAPGVTGHTWLWWATTPTHGYQIDAAAPPYRTAPGVEVRLRRWADVVAPYRHGVAVAALR
ncbi:MAG: hypothetical protein ACO3VG_05860 [Nitriliruptoraceae bacterium]